MVWCIINKKLNYRLASQTKNSLVDKIGERYGEIPR